MVFSIGWSGWTVLGGKFPQLNVFSYFLCFLSFLKKKNLANSCLRSYGWCQHSGTKHGKRTHPHSMCRLTLKLFYNINSTLSWAWFLNAESMWITLCPRLGGDSHPDTWGWQKICRPFWFLYTLTIQFLFIQSNVNPIFKVRVTSDSWSSIARSSFLLVLGSWFSFGFLSYSQQDIASYLLRYSPLFQLPIFLLLSPFSSLQFSVLLCLNSK